MIDRDGDAELTPQCSYQIGAAPTRLGGRHHPSESRGVAAQIERAKGRHAEGPNGAMLGFCRAEEMPHRLQGRLGITRRQYHMLQNAIRGMAHRANELCASALDSAQ